MRQNPEHGSGPSAVLKGSVRQTYPHALTESHGDDSSNMTSVDRWSHESTAARKTDSLPKGHDRHLNGEQEVIRSGLDDFLARPPPSFDYVQPDGGESQLRDCPLQAGGNSTISRSLPELTFSRAGNIDDRSGGGYLTRKKTPDKEQGLQHTGTTIAGISSNFIAPANRRASKPARSQSGGLFRRAPCSSVGGARTGNATVFGCQESAVSAGTSSNKNATIAASFTGEDAALLDQAFAFAKTVAREEEAEIELRLCRGGRRLGRGGAGSAARLPLHQCGGDGGRLRLTRSSGSSVVLGSGGDMQGSSVEGGRVEVEDWVRGLPQSSHVPSEQSNHHPITRSINQATTKRRDNEGGLEVGHRETVSRPRRLVVGCRRRQEVDSGALRFDRRREKEESKKAAETAELVKRFEAGTGVAALRAELEASWTSMRRSAEAIEQVASRWHQQRLMPTSAGTA